jgi:hypothetical protein
METKTENIPAPTADTPLPKVKTPKAIKPRAVKPIRERPPLRVCRFQGRWTFLVESESSKHFQQPGEEWKEDAHTVDLEEGLIRVPGQGVQVNGQCDCSDFGFNRHKVMVCEKKLSRCKHIKAAMYFLMSDLILETLRREQATKESQSLDDMFCV